MDMIITFPGGKKVDATYNGVTVHTDQPVSVGGDASAATPFDTFLASIGTCAGIYVSSFCKQRGIDTDGIRLVQRMNWNALERRINQIEIDIQVPPDFPEQYKEAVIRSADLCAVKKHLHHPPEFLIKTSVGN
ncbi:OsmC family protein [candidate division KSB1 bacterium]|nr:OsmC family protein [candidate division KSB1 bacterium]